LRDRLKRQLDMDAGQTRVVSEGDLHRVRIGPYASDDEARQRR